jgi:hypothetical protein
MIVIYEFYIPNYIHDSSENVESILLFVLSH